MKENPVMYYFKFESKRKEFAKRTASYRDNWEENWKELTLKQVRDLYKFYELSYFSQHHVVLSSLVVGLFVSALTSFAPLLSGANSGYYYQNRYFSIFSMILLGILVVVRSLKIYLATLSAFGCAQIVVEDFSLPKWKQFLSRYEYHLWVEFAFAILWAGAYILNLNGHLLAYWQAFTVLIFLFPITYYLSTSRKMRHDKTYYTSIRLYQLLLLEMPQNKEDEEEMKCAVIYAIACLTGSTD